MHDNRNTNPTDSFYEESPQYPVTTQQNNLKRPLTLDLNGAKQQVKKQRFNQSVTTPAVLSSPDLLMLRLNTPDLDKFIMSTNGLSTTPTPGLFPTGTKVRKKSIISFLLIFFLNMLIHVDSSFTVSLVNFCH